MDSTAIVKEQMNDLESYYVIFLMRLVLSGRQWFFRLVFVGLFLSGSSDKLHAQTDSLPSNSLSDSLDVTTFHPPTKWAFIKNVPKDMWQMAKAPFKREYLVGLTITSAANALLIWQDQKLMDGALQFGRHVQLAPETRYGVILRLFNTKIIKYPQNLNTAFYQLGEGGTSMLIAAGLFIHGKIKNDNRSLQTASDLAETFITMGLSTQLLKRSFGRQSPFVATRPGGEWHPFPSFTAYQQHTPNFDGFPSGHLATMMATVTVLSANYPEKKWIKPLGYTLMGLSAFAMMNTEVHWAGDYPLALALGYLSAKITVGRHQFTKKSIL